MSKDTIDLVFSFDTTGSMFPCLTQVRRYVDQTVRELFQLIPKIRIGIITHGDYCDGRFGCLTSLDLSDHPSAICAFIKNAPATDGGDSPECYELVLNTARGMTWQSRRNKALVLIGDDVPHPVGYIYGGRRNDLSWVNEAELLVEAGIQIYPIQALARRHADFFYNKLSVLSGTEKLELPQFNDITDIILAICHSRAGRLTQFEETLRERHKPASWHVMANIDRLAKRSVRRRPVTSAADTTYIRASGDSSKRLKGVHPSRFQILDIGDRDISIREFVEANGLTFKKGRGFYEFTKSEIVQEYKEVVLEDRMTGRFFTGDKARIIAGLPIGRRGKFKPEPTKYTVFIQSTSYNRRLKAGTRFLYEIGDLIETEARAEPEKPARTSRAHRHRVPARSMPTPRTINCSICGNPGHNKRTCPKRMVEV